MATFIWPRNPNFGTLFCNFMTKYFIPKKAPIRLAPLWRNITTCGTKRYALNSQRSQLFNASKISFQLALKARIKVYLCRKFSNNFPGPEKCLKRNGKRIFGKAVSSRVFSGHESVSRFRDAILRIGQRNHMHRKERERSCPMHKKSALNSLWMALWRQNGFRTFW